jgi:hypothetical protein
MELQNISWTLSASTFSSYSYQVKIYLKTTQTTRQTTIMQRACSTLSKKHLQGRKSASSWASKLKAEDPRIFSQPFTTQTGTTLTQGIYNRRSREIRINTTNSPASGAGNVSENGLMLRFGRVRVGQCVSGWRCQYSYNHVTEVGGL